MKTARIARRRRLAERCFRGAAWFAILLGLGVLAALVADTLWDGAPRLRWNFLTGWPSRKAAEAGILPALAGTAAVMLATVVVALPIALGAALHLEEFSKKNVISRIIEFNLANLAGVPSILYGLLGLAVFVRAMSLDRSVLAAGATLALLILPVLIVTFREALRAVPLSIREAALALGATRWQAVRHQVLPLALPGMITGAILAFSRAIGETAPLICIGALTYVRFLPDGPFSPYTVLPLQIFNWTSRPQKAFHANAAAGIVVLLAVTLFLSAGAIWLRNRRRKRPA